MREHLLTITKVTNGFIIEVNNNYNDVAEDGSLPQYKTFVAKSPEEVLAYVNQHSGLNQSQQQALPL